MPPKLSNAAAVVRQDLPWALSILGNPDADPTQLPLALNFLAAISLAQLPQDVEGGVQLLTLSTPFMCANDSNVTSAAIKVVTRLYSEAQEALREALRQPASLQAFWAVPAYFHASFDAYAARLAVINSEPQEPVATPVKKPDSRLSKGPPPPPVDPESTLPGPSKYALDAALGAISAAVGHGPEAEEAAVEVLARDVAPWLTLLRHHSSRIQVLTLRLMRLLLRWERFATALAAVNAMVPLCGLLASSPYGAVREEILLVLTRLMSSYAPAMHQALDAGLPSLLLKHLLAPTTGVPVEPSPPGTELPQTPQPSLPAPGATAGPRPSSGTTARVTGTGVSVDGGPEAAPEVPPGPPPIDFSRPMISSPDRLQELSASILQQLAKLHQGAAQELLRLGAMQLLLALLPAPVLPELPPQPRKRVSSASETFFAGIAGKLRPSQTGGPTTAPKPRDTWRPFIEDAPTLPLPAARLTSHALQASLLVTLSCLLAEPGVQDYWWSVHATKRLHLQLMFLLTATAPPPAKPEPVTPVTPSRRGSVATVAQPTAPPPPDLTKPPFPAEVRSAALQCLLQLIKWPEWLQLTPYLASFQETVRDQEHWDNHMVAPLAEILQRVVTARLPLPPRAAASAAATAAAAAAASAAAGGADAPPLLTLSLCPAVANGLSAEDNGLSEAPLSDEEAATALKELAKQVRRMNDPWVTSVVAAALLVLPDSAILAPPWPPLPSPPPTPPPPPLPTSQYLWDALGRPVMTDGIKLAHL